MAIADTSREAFARILPLLPDRCAAVYGALEAYERQFGKSPTSYELFEFMRGRGEAFDLNSVRPYLTVLKKRDAVGWNGRRECSITRDAAHTWTITGRLQELPKVPRQGNGRLF